MKKHTPLIFSAALALCLAVTVTLRVDFLHRDFDRTVRKARNTTAGYDKQFIGMVNRLEKELAGRASFGYEGGKDPMTGQVRQVVLPSAPPPPAAQNHRADTGPEKAKDPVKLTAIIYDDKNNRYTAVVMDGERSYSLEVGDKVRARIIRKITAGLIVMEDDSLFYQYDIFGKCVTKRK